MEGYLGSKMIDQSLTEFDGYDRDDWAMYFISSYGQIEGDHHRAWVLDQVARILKGSPVVVYQHSWSNGYTENRVSVGEPSPEYCKWRKEMRGDWDPGFEEYEYDYDEGIAP